MNDNMTYEAWLMIFNELLFAQAGLTEEDGETPVDLKTMFLKGYTPQLAVYHWLKLNNVPKEMLNANHRARS